MIPLIALGIGLGALGIGAALALAGANEPPPGADKVKPKESSIVGDINEQPPADAPWFAECHSLGYNSPTYDAQRKRWDCRVNVTQGNWIDPNNTMTRDNLGDFGYRQVYSDGDAILIRAIARVYDLPELVTTPPRKWSSWAVKVVRAVIDRNLTQLQVGKDGADFHWWVRGGGKSDGWNLRGVRYVREFRSSPQDPSQIMLPPEADVPGRYPVLYFPKLN